MTFLSTKGVDTTNLEIKMHYQDWLLVADRDEQGWGKLSGGIVGDWGT